MAWTSDQTCPDRGGRGSAGQHATQNTAHIRAGRVHADVMLRPVDDVTINTQVGAAYESKYRSQRGSLRPMIAPTAAETTVRPDNAD